MPNTDVIIRKWPAPKPRPSVDSQASEKLSSLRHFHPCSLQFSKMLSQHLVKVQKLYVSSWAYRLGKKICSDKTPLHKFHLTLVFAFDSP